MLSFIDKENEIMRKKKEKNKRKKTVIGILLSVLFTAVVPIGFVFLMGLLSESFPVLYFYTKQIFTGFIVLLIAGIAMIFYQIYHYFKGGNIDPEKEERKERRELRKQRRSELADSKIKQGVISE